MSSILSVTPAQNETATVDETVTVGDVAILAMRETLQGLIDNGDLDLDDYRAHYETTYGKASTLDDDTLLTVIATANVANNDDREPKDWAGLMREAETAESDAAMVVSQETSSDIMAVAHNLGAKLAKDEAFVSSMGKLQEAREFSKRGNAIIYMRLEKDWTADDWARVPRPGSKKSDLLPGSNDTYDVWSVKDHANEGRAIKFSFFEEVAKTIPFYRDIVTEYEDISDVLKKEPTLGNARRMEMRNTWGRVKQKAHKATMLQRKGAFLSSVKEAVSLKRQFDTVNKLLGKGLTAKLLTAKNDNGELEVLPVTSPVEVSKKGDPSICAPYTIKTFLKLKPETALEKSGGNEDKFFEELDATLTRAPKKKGTPAIGDAAKYPTIEGPSDFDSCIGALSNYTDDRDNLLAIRKWLREGNEDEREHKVQSFGDAMLPLLEVWKSIRPLYETLQQKDKLPEAKAS